MRIDVVSIFPEYLAPLTLALPGKARAAGLLDVRVHDLREWTHDRHRTVDDTPYGGGAGMVMRPEPWGDALDAVLGPGGPGDDPPVLVVPTPAGERFTQAVAADLATRAWLIFACGRYEGIDERVVDDAVRRVEVRELSIGDYVLNGGEVAALVITEAVVRLLPGFLGNPASLTEESHGESGLLEYPLYTKPPSWRGLDVPEVLLSGDHAAIAAWREREAVRRTVTRRPDLRHPSVLRDGAELRAVEPADVGELLTLQRACLLQEAVANPGLDIEALTDTYEDVRGWVAEGTTLVLRRGGRLVAAARGRLSEGSWTIGRLMVAPDLQGQGLGRLMLEHIERAAPPEATGFDLCAWAGSDRNQRIYRRAGYRPAGAPRAGVVRMTKRRP
ncbi:MAG: tRNA (guanosine(37)-N1)-methyltransferase TrmD [Nocardioidaceae bacterium]